MQTSLAIACALYGSTLLWSCARKGYFGTNSLNINTSEEEWKDVRVMTYWSCFVYSRVKIERQDDKKSSTKYYLRPVNADMISQTEKIHRLSEFNSFFYFIQLSRKLE